MSDSSKSVLLDVVYVRRFITLLLKDFEKWDAFELGIIDKDGNIIKKRVDRRTSEDKKAFTKFHKVVLTVKKTLNKISPNKITSVIAAIAILREHCENEGIDPILMESHFIKCIKDEHNINYIQLIGEEVPTNSTANVANPELTRYTKSSKKSADINMHRRNYEPSTDIDKKKKKKAASKKDGNTNR